MAKVRRLRLVCALAALGLAAPAPAVRAQEKTLVVKSWNLCDYKTDLDGQWEGSIVASDGNCYFASSTHSGRTSAMFFKFDPRTQQITVLTKDISAVCGEDPTVQAPQGKIHSPVAEMDGWLYFGTHEAYNTQARPYTGAHLIGYELQSGEFRDFGVIETGYTNYAGVAADPNSKCIYMYLVTPGQGGGRPCLLYRVDMPAGEKHKVAELAPGGYNGAVFYLYVDAAGNCWLPEPNGVLVKYDRAKDSVQRFPDALPDKVAQRSREWFFAAPLAGTQMGVVTNHTKAYVFDPAAETDRFRLVKEFDRIHIQSECGWAMSGSRVLFIQAEGEGRRAPLHLKSVDMAAKNPELVDYGRITDQDGRAPWRLPSIAGDAQGNVYLTGDWVTLPDDTATTRLSTRGGAESYPVQRRAERFSYVRIPPAQ